MTTSPGHVDGAAGDVLSTFDLLAPQLRELYVDLHAHPELSGQEERTAGVVAEHLRAAGLEVTTGVGGHGVVGVLRNGVGPVVMVRADQALSSDSSASRCSRACFCCSSIMRWAASVRFQLL